MSHAALSASALIGSVVLVSAGAWAGLPKEVDDRLTGPWPVDVPGFVAPAPGEHPRLLFRKADLPKLKERINTPEGKAILDRLRVQLNGSDGQSMPKIGGAPAKGDDEFGPAGVYSFSHMAGFGLLYQLTGDKKYADLGKECMEKAFEGTPNFDTRYGFKNPNGALRAGPSLGWTAVGYDLCYDGWDPDYRQKVAKAIQTFHQDDPNLSFEGLVTGYRQHPGSNHWGMIVGGGALAVLAIANDPGVDMAKVGPLLDASQKSIKVQCTQGWGTGGLYVEGDGTGSMSSHIALLSAIQAWRIAGGKDFYTPRPYAQWMNLKWFHLTALGGDPANLRKSFPERGDYPHNIWGRAGLSGGNYFGIGFGVTPDAQKPALLWFYNHSGLKDLDARNKYGLDAPSAYPHHSVLSFVNWPIGMQEKNPQGLIPNAYMDDKAAFFAWRNRWQDKDDVIISIITRSVKGNMGTKADKQLTIQYAGKVIKWGNFAGPIKTEYKDFKPAKDGSTVVVTSDGGSLAIDFSQASGADAMLVMTGPGAPGDNVVEAGGRKFSFLFLGGKAAKPQVAGDKITVGGQTVSFDGTKIVLEK